MCADTWSPADPGGWPAPFDTDPGARQGIASDRFDHELADLARAALSV